MIYNNEYYLPWFDKLDRTTAFLLMDCEVNQGFAARIVHIVTGKPDDEVIYYTSDSVQQKKLVKEMAYFDNKVGSVYRDWETDRKSTRLNSSHSAKSRMPSSA